jgi:hypothetical protein
MNAARIGENAANLASAATAEPTERAAAASEQAAEPQAPSVDALLAELERTQEPSRLCSLCVALGRAGDEVAIDALGRLASHPAPEVASAALSAISRIGGSLARAALEQRLSAAPDSELEGIVEAVVALGGDDASEVLRRAARSRRVALRTAAGGAIEQFDEGWVHELMLEKLAGPEALRGDTYFADTLEPKAVPRLEELARQSAGELQAAALTALVQQGPPGHARVERLAFDEELGDAVLEAAKDVRGLRRTLRAASIERLRVGGLTSSAVFDYLARDLTDEAREALRQAAREPASSERALDALASRGDTASRRVLVELARDGNRELACLAQMKLLERPDSRAWEDIARVRAPGLVPAVRQALQSLNAPEASGRGWLAIEK